MTNIVNETQVKDLLKNCKLNTYTNSGQVNLIFEGIENMSNLNKLDFNVPKIIENLTDDNGDILLTDIIDIVAGLVVKTTYGIMNMDSEELFKCVASLFSDPLYHNRLLLNSTNNQDMLYYIIRLLRGMCDSPLWDNEILRSIYDKVLVTVTNHDIAVKKKANMKNENKEDSDLAKDAVELLSYNIADKIKDKKLRTEVYRSILRKAA